MAPATHPPFVPSAGGGGVTCPIHPSPQRGEAPVIYHTQRHRAQMYYAYDENEATLQARRVLITLPGLQYDVLRFLLRSEDEECRRMLTI